MVETTIRTVDRNASFRAVHASKGKITRAEPIAALAEQRRIHHVGTFPELEDQLCTFAAGSADSPDRLDAMVWGFTDLMVSAPPPVPIVAPIIGGGGSCMPGRANARGFDNPAVRLWAWTRPAPREVPATIGCAAAEALDAQGAAYARAAAEGRRAAV